LSQPVTRMEWGADTVAFTLIKQPVPHSVAHHTASAVVGGKDASEAVEKAYMRGTETYHQSLGWLTVAYHTVAFPSGRRYIGRPSWAKGGATLGQNDTSLACCAVGNYEVSEPSQELLDAMRDTFIEWETEPLMKGVHPTWGHRDVSEAGTACPGNNLYSKLAYLRSREEDDLSEKDVKDGVLGAFSLNEKGGQEVGDLLNVLSAWLAGEVPEGARRKAMYDKLEEKFGAP
jgi:hypothetical protein